VVGEGWITRFDLFEENVRYFPSLLPEVPTDPVAELAAGRTPQLAELRLHNGRSTGGPAVYEVVRDPRWRPVRGSTTVTGSIGTRRFHLLDRAVVQTQLRQLRGAPAAVRPRISSDTSAAATGIAKFSSNRRRSR